jgi:putative ABC transport system permease protein
LMLWEGVLISIAGLAVGVPLGLIWTEALRFLFPDMFVAGIAVSWPGMALAIGGALAAALAASALPAWSASRLSPLEAMSPLAPMKSQGPPVGWTVVGFVLICIDPVIVYFPWAKWLNNVHPSANAEAVATLVRFYAHLGIGVVSLFLGFFLVAPLLVWSIEHVFAGAVGWILGLPGTLLRQQLSSGLWRAAGAGAALMVGLAVLLVMTSQGISMLDGWKLPDKFPDIFLVSLKLGGLNPEQWAKVGQTPGIQHFPNGEPELLPVAITISGLGNNPLALVGAALAPKMNGTMFFGVPPKAAFKMMQLDFRDNDGRTVGRDQQPAYADRAERELELGRHVIVTEDYRRLHHVKYGDTIDLYSETQKYPYTICGIVWSPGLDVVVSMFDMGRQLDQRTAGMVFGSLDDAKRDFGVDHINLFIANLETGVDKKAVLESLRANLGDLNIHAGDVRQIKAAIDSGFRRILALLTTVAFSALAVASMGVTNTIMASIRSRRWQLGVLRSIGLCGGELLRMVLAEAVLLGIVGLALGLGCGMILSFDARELAGDVLGYLPPMVIPWGYVGIGSGAVMLVSIAAALWPAWSVSRTEPLMLLQAGRGAA